MEIEKDAINALENALNVKKTDALHATSFVYVARMKYVEIVNGMDIVLPVMSFYVKGTCNMITMRVSIILIRMISMMRMLAQKKANIETK